MSQNTAAFQSGDEKQQLSNRESNKAGLQLTLDTAQLSGSSAAQQSPVAEFGDTSVRKKPASRRAHRWLGLWRYGHSLKRGVRSWDKPSRGFKGGADCAQAVCCGGVGAVPLCVNPQRTFNRSGQVPPLFFSPEVTEALTRSRCLRHRHTTFN
ncbi:hypothetical protein AMECASPLE_028167 [Ameca splendens]|uniref:Uncharacterized protein n=1 Tax=Ameca splendens TaxID=208324 RepID=A0ABV0XIJ1_9TELE